MKYVKQLGIILLISFLGEALKCFIPLPIPASIYGMLLLFFALCTHLIKLEQVKDVGLFLVEIMPVFFVSAGVGLMDSWDSLCKLMIPVLLSMSVVTVVVMAISGKTTDLFIEIQEKKTKSTMKKGDD